MKKSNIYGWTPERINSLKGKTFVITGANAGAGYAVPEINIILRVFIKPYG